MTTRRSVGALARGAWVFGLALACGCTFDGAGPRFYTRDASVGEEIIVLWDGARDVHGDGDATLDGPRPERSVDDATVDGPVTIINGRLVFAQSSGDLVLRDWSFDDLSWKSGPVGPATNIETTHWAQLRDHALGDVLLLKGLVVDNEYLELWQHQAGQWRQTALRSIYRGSDNIRMLDAFVEREAVSGELLYVFGNRDQVPQFATFENGSWSRAAAIGDFTELKETVDWVKLVPRPGSDEMMLIYADADQRLHALRWTGSAWDAASYKRVTDKLGVHDSNDRAMNRSFDGAYERSSGDFLLVWGREDHQEIQWGQWTDGAWDIPGDEPITNYQGYTDFISLASQPAAGSDRIAAVFADLNNNTERMAAGIWDGSAWVGLKQYDNSIFDYQESGRGDYILDVGWVGDKAIAVYPDRDEGGQPRTSWLSWSAGDTDWTHEGNLVVTGMGRVESVMMVEQTHPVAGIVTILSDSSSRLFALFYDGTQWKRRGVSALTSDLASTTSVPFHFESR